MQVPPSAITLRAACVRALRVGSVLGDDLDGVLDAGLLDGGVDLLGSEVGSLAAGGTEVGEVAGERNEVADRQVDLGRSPVTPAAAGGLVVVVAAGSEARGEHESRGRDGQCQARSLHERFLLFPTLPGPAVFGAGRRPASSISPKPYS